MCLYLFLCSGSYMCRYMCKHRGLTPVTACVIFRHAGNHASNHVMKTTHIDINGHTRAYWGTFGFAVLTPTGELTLRPNGKLPLSEQQEATLMAHACQHWGLDYGTLLAL